MKQLSRVITLKTRSLTPDSSGGQIESWTDLESVWADFMPRAGGEYWRGAADRTQARRAGEFIIRWRDDLDQTMRIYYDGLNWNITDIEELGIRRQLRLRAIAE